MAHSQVSSELGFQEDPDFKHFDDRTFAYQYRPFRGMIQDFKRRAPFYLDDWKVGFMKPKTTIPSIIRMYFINLFPAIAYTLDMRYRTEGAYGINECIFATFLAALVFSVFSIQPLTIVGVTGLINLFNYTTFDIMKPTGVDYLQFQAWVLIWSAITHWITAIFNLSDYCRYITDMVSDTFGLYVGIIYIQKGVELLTVMFAPSLSAGWMSALLALVFAFSVYYLEMTGELTYGPSWARKALREFSFGLCIIFFTGFVYIPGNIADTSIEYVPVTRSFYPSTERGWVIKFWELEVKWVFCALPFGCLVTLLFYFDNNVSGLMSQSRAFPVKKPAGFHWDFFLLGCVTIVSGILGLPAPNGLVPQAILHTDSLCETRLVKQSTVYRNSTDELNEQVFNNPEKENDNRNDGVQYKSVKVHVVEQRLTHFVMGLLSLGTMSRPLLDVLGKVPIALFAGIFIVIGWTSVSQNPIVHRSLYLLHDPSLVSSSHPLRSLSRNTIAKFLSIQWLTFAAMIAVSETNAGVGFPIIITALIPIRHAWVGKWVGKEELNVLDQPTANSAAVLSSLGGPIFSKESLGKRSM